MKKPFVDNFVLLIMILVISFGSIANTIDHIIETKELELCAHPQLLPFSEKLENPDGALGFQVDLAHELANKLDVSMNVSWVISKRHVKKTDCDFYAGVAKIAERDSKYVKISDAYYRMGFVVVTLGNQPTIESIKQLNGLTVGVSSGSVASFALRENNIATAIRFNNENVRLQALIAEKIDAAVVSSLAAKWFVKDSGIELRLNDAERVLGVSLNYDYALGLRKADSETLDVFNTLLSKMKADGSFSRLFEKYGLTNAVQFPVTNFSDYHK